MRPVSGSSVRFVLAAATALCAMAVAFQGEIAKAVQPDRLLDMVAEEELPTFVVVDMADALDRVVEASSAEN
jgi:hypothetical protein